MIHPSHSWLPWKCDVCWYWVIALIGSMAINMLLVLLCFSQKVPA